MLISKYLNNCVCKDLQKRVVEEIYRHNKGDRMKNGEKLVIVGCSGAGGPAAMMAKKLMPEIDVTVLRKEEFFIVR